MNVFIVHKLKHLYDLIDIDEHASKQYKRPVRPFVCVCECVCACKRLCHLSATFHPNPLKSCHQKHVIHVCIVDNLVSLIIQCDTESHASSIPLFYVRHESV